MGSVGPVYVLSWFWVFWGYFIPHVTCWCGLTVERRLTLRVFGAAVVALTLGV